MILEIALGILVGFILIKFISEIVALFVIVLMLCLVIFVYSAMSFLSLLLIFLMATIVYFAGRWIDRRLMNIDEVNKIISSETNIFSIIDEIFNKANVIFREGKISKNRIELEDEVFNLMVGKLKYGFGMYEDEMGRLYISMKIKGIINPLSNKIIINGHTRKIFTNSLFLNKDENLKKIENTLMNLNDKLTYI